MHSLEADNFSRRLAAMFLAVVLYASLLHSELNCFYGHLGIVIKNLTSCSQTISRPKLKEFPTQFPTLWSPAR